MVSFLGARATGSSQSGTKEDLTRYPRRSRAACCWGCCGLGIPPVRQQVLAQGDHLALFAKATSEADGGRLTRGSRRLNQKFLEPFSVFADIIWLKAAGGHVPLQFLSKWSALLLAKQPQHGAQRFAPGGQQGGCVGRVLFSHWGL